MNTKCVVSFAKSFFFLDYHIYHTKNGDIMTNFICLAWLIFEENENRIQKSPSQWLSLFFSLKSTQQKFKELLSEHCQLHCRKKNAAELSWWWLNQTIIVSHVLNLERSETISHPGALWVMSVEKRLYDL